MSLKRSRNQEFHEFFIHFSAHIFLVLSIFKNHGSRRFEKNAFPVAKKKQKRNEKTAKKERM